MSEQPPKPNRLQRLGDGISWLASRVVQRAESHTSLEQGAYEFGQDLLALVDELKFLPQRVQIKPVKNQFYGHGAFMGAAPLLFADATWRRILAFLMPDVYRQVREKVDDGAKGSALIPMFENNPVMCAYGVWTGIRIREKHKGAHPPGEHDLAGIEWDVFINGKLIDKWEKAKGEAREALMDEIVDTMVIAHASTVDTVHEQMGFDQYGDVRRTSKTGMGGVEANAWMDLFGRALALAEAPDLDAAMKAMAPLPRFEKGDECQLHTFRDTLPYPEVIERFRKVTGRDRFSVVIEIKSLASTAELLVDMVKELNRRGVHVAGVCSFKLEEVAGVAAHSQLIDGVRYDGPREVLFFHFAASLQQACDKGQVPMGQSVLFNGGSLLELAEPGAPLPYHIKDEVIEDVLEYKQRWDLHIGLYVQENDCDAIAAGLLSELVDARADVFDLGFAWGGLQDEAATEFDEDRIGDLRGFGSQKLLGYVGRAIHWEVSRSVAEAEKGTDKK